MTKNVIKAELDGKNLGNGINSLAAEGKIKGCFMSVGLPTNVLAFNSVWALTDWKKANGYYKDGAHLLPKLGEIIYAA